MQLSAYETYAVNSSETASNAAAIVTTSNSTVGTATATVNFPAGTYDLGINYYDLISGRSIWEVSLSNKTVGQWTGTHEDTLGHAPSIYLDGHSATLVTLHGVEVKEGAVLQIVGTPDGIEPASLDYVVLLPSGVTGWLEVRDDTMQKRERCLLNGLLGLQLFVLQAILVCDTSVSMSRTELP